LLSHNQAKAHQMYESRVHTALKSGLSDNTTSKSGRADLDFPMAR